MDKEQADYLSYLLRMWRVSREGEAVWRTSLESPHTGRRRVFASLTDLFAYLEKEVGLGARRPAGRNADEKGGDVHD